MTEDSSNSTIESRSRFEHAVRHEVTHRVPKRKMALSGAKPGFFWMVFWALAPHHHWMQKTPILWHNVAFMILNPLAALVFTPIYLYNHGFSWGLLAFLLVTYTISNMSITSGYHRYFAHKSYSLKPWMEWLYILFGAGAFQGSILHWCTDHRRHHRDVDTDDDPYSINKGFWYAHLIWMFRDSPHPEAYAFPKDLTSNKWIALQHKYYVWVASFMGFILPGLVGWATGFGFWGGVIIGGCLRITLSQHSTFLVNSAAHTFGTRPYTEKNTARDSVIVAVLTYGEGYHNFHHFFQADYRNGIRWYQWDPTKWWIQALAMLGIATKLKKARKEEIFKARLAMEEKMILTRGYATSERVEQVKVKLIQAQVKMRQLHDDYRSAKAAFKQKRVEMGQEMRRQMQAQLAKLKAHRKTEMRVTKLEFKTAYSEWRQFRRPRKTAQAA